MKPYKACACRDPSTGKQLGARCPDLPKKNPRQVVRTLRGTAWARRQAHPAPARPVRYREAG